ncbi:hypothetical protein RHIZ_20670 [Rhizobium skierniewicense]|uniref:hypothetical protein n=1 Tax=Rhizobium skierniewicense TaxID=984260 RepID=UPI001FACFA29|nr:hypothetical protein [Rhizobium skierniewicense]MCI9868385.1 hypothetical protein [Rhizobium skierniewicense]
MIRVLTIEQLEFVRDDGLFLKQVLLGQLYIYAIFLAAVLKLDVIDDMLNG